MLADNQTLLTLTLYSPPNRSCSQHRPTEPKTARPSLAASQGTLVGKPTTTCAQWLVRCGALSACGGWTPVLSAPARVCTTRSGSRTRHRDAAGSAPTDSYSCARDADRTLWVVLRAPKVKNLSFCARPNCRLRLAQSKNLKTGLFALGPKNVHQLFSPPVPVSRAVPM